MGRSRGLGLAGAIALLGAAAARPAAAGPYLALDGQLLSTLGGSEAALRTKDLGWSGGARAGWRLSLGALGLERLVVSPEVAVDTSVFSPFEPVFYGWSVHAARAVAGLRAGLTFDATATALAFAHAGRAELSVDGDGVLGPYAYAGGGLTFDAGLALDVRLEDHVLLGAHAAFVRVDAPLDDGASGRRWSSDGAHWLELGVELTVDLWP